MSRKALTHGLQAHGDLKRMAHVQQEGLILLKNSRLIEV